MFVSGIILLSHWKRWGMAGAYVHNCGLLCFSVPDFRELVHNNNNCSIMHAICYFRLRKDLIINNCVSLCRTELVHERKLKEKEEKWGESKSLNILANWLGLVRLGFRRFLGFLGWWAHLWVIENMCGNPNAKYSMYSRKNTIFSDFIDFLVDLLLQARNPSKTYGFLCVLDGSFL